MGNVAKGFALDDVGFERFSFEHTEATEEVL
jgi:hypothetical protein